MAEQTKVAMDLESRKRFISDMKGFIEKECAQIGEILTEISWTPDHILQKSTLCRCPHDPTHEMPESSLQKHEAVCHLRKLGLNMEEISKELQKDDFFYENANLVGKVQLDEGSLNRILWNYCMENRQVSMGHRCMPMSVEDWPVKLSAQERLAVYEHCVQTLKAEGKMPNVEKDEDLTTDWERIIRKGLLEMGGEKPKSKLELMAMLRDQKRRRQSYRAKNVHVTKKSYTEIIRELIQNQMEIMMPANESGKESQGDNTELAPDRNTSHQPQKHSRDRSRSSSPKRQRRRSRSPYRKRSRHRRDTYSPRRSRSRSESPVRKESVIDRQERDDSQTLCRGEGVDNEKKLSKSSAHHSSLQDYEEGQLESADSSPASQQSRSHSKKKSSKSRHKKHKHKKYKS